MSPAHLAKSYEKVNYVIRPSKQIERKLFMEAVHCLSRSGYPLSEYTYLGFGSVYYADFILFHKYLYIDHMICVEAADIPVRMTFNKPYDFNKLEMRPVSNIIANISPKKKYLAWLDYDVPLDMDIISDVDGFLGTLGPGSILILTIEAEPRVPDSVREDESSKKSEDDLLLMYFQQKLGLYLSRNIKSADISRSELPNLLAEIIRAVIENQMLSRKGLEFHELFNFRYSDGTQMLTLGGMIEKKSNKEQLNRSGIYDLDFIRPGGRPLAISVPPLTLREKHLLDQKIGSGPISLNKPSLEFKSEWLENYKKYYKHYPIFHEALL